MRDYSKPRGDKGSTRAYNRHTDNRAENSRKSAWAIRNKKPWEWSKRDVLLETDIANVITLILAREGGFTDDPADRGGATNFGITQHEADAYGLGPVQNMSETTATAFYRARFKEWKIDQIPDLATFSLVADSCVNHGEGMGIKWLQAAIGGGIPIDGVIGPKTIAQLVIVPNWARVRASILSARIRFYGRIVANDHSQARFISGWLNRATDFLTG